MLLTEVLTSLVTELDIARITRDQYGRAIRRLDEHLGRGATTEDLIPDTINGYLLWLESQYKLSATSVCNYRTAIIRVWHFAHDPLQVANDCPTRRIRRPKKRPKIVHAWTLSELGMLIDSAEGLAGHLRCGIPSAEFLTAWLWVGYETGLRPSDLRRLCWGNVDFSNNSITVVQSKTGSIHSCSFGPESAKSLEKLKAYGLDRVFPLDKWGTRRWEGYLYARAAKLGFGRRERQGIGTLRKTHATEVYRSHGLAAAAESLGHSSGTRVARGHYIDSSIKRGIVPPSPGGCAKGA